MTQQGLRILILDDDQVATRAMSRLLSMEGFLVDTAPDVESARGLAAENAPGLLLTDVMLGTQLGTDFATELQAQLPELEVFVISGLPEDKLQELTAELQNLRVYVKPVDVHLLTKEAHRVAARLAN